MKRFKTDRQSIFITGASGFLGSRLLDSLTSDNIPAIGVSSKQFNIITKKGFDTFDFSIISVMIHAAGKVFVPDSWKNPELYYQINTIGTQHILDLCRAHHIPLIFISGYVYGSDVENPIKISTPPKPNNPYAHSKYLAEELCRFYAENFGVRVTILRPFNIIGEGQDINFLVPRLIDQALNCERIEVMDLAPKRDFIYIEDVVSAIKKTIHCDSNFEIFNVGSGISYSVKEVIDIIQSVLGTNKEIVCSGDRRVNEIDDVTADIRAIKDKLGWEPRYSLKEAIALIHSKLEK